jgi:hypothetical protein
MTLLIGLGQARQGCTARLSVERQEAPPRRLHLREAEFDRQNEQPPTILNAKDARSDPLGPVIDAYATR